MIVKMVILVIVNYFVLILLKIIFVIGFIIFIIIVFGSNNRFDWSVDFLWIVWIYKGNIIFVLIIVIVIIELRIIDNENIGYLNICSLSIGLLIISWC